MFVHAVSAFITSISRFVGFVGREVLLVPRGDVNHCSGGAPTRSPPRDVCSDIVCLSWDSLPFCCGVPLGKVPTTFGSAEDSGCTPMSDRIGSVARSSDGCV